MRKLVLLILCLFCFFHAHSQTINEEFERIRLGDDPDKLFVGIDISPDGKYLAVSGNKNSPLYIYDWQQGKIIKSFDIDDWVAGSAVEYSKKGKYLLIQQLKMIDWAANKDKEVTFDIIDATTGKTVKRLDPYHAVCISPDEQFALALTADRVEFWNLSNGKIEKTMKVENASNGLAISPDGSMIAVSHHVRENALTAMPRYKNDKKALKIAAKCKHEITIYNTDDLTKKFTVDELYDIVYKLSYSDDGKTLYCMQIPHVKVQANANERQTYISTIDGETGVPSRKGYSSNAIYEPDFKLSHDGKLFGIVSQGARFLELHAYDAETAKMKYRFKQSWRLMEKSEGEFIIGNSRTTFVFLPDDKNVIMTMGNSLIKWNIESNE